MNMGKTSQFEGCIVAVLGASAKPERYSNKALKELSQSGYKVIPVNPALKEIDGIEVAPSLCEIREKVDTVTLYLSPERSEEIAKELVALKPRRVIFNPGTENPELQKALQSKGIETIEACTLVMLRTATF